MHENGIHDYLKYVKFGYGRGTDHACKDIRGGKMTREEGIEMVRRYDHVKPRGPRALARVRRHDRGGVRRDRRHVPRPARVGRDEPANGSRTTSGTSISGARRRRCGEARHPARRADGRAGAAYAADVAWLLERRSHFVSAACPPVRATTRRTRRGASTSSTTPLRRLRDRLHEPAPTRRAARRVLPPLGELRVLEPRGLPGLRGGAARSIFRPRVERIAEIADRHAPEAHALLDVGAGFGTFCEEVASSTVPSVIALEPEPHLAATCRAKAWR